MAKPVANVTIERDVLLKMAGDKRFSSLVPSLRQLKRKIDNVAKNCGCGRKKAAKIAQQDIEQAKMQVANTLGANVELQRQMKTLLNTKQVRIKYRTGTAGSRVKKF